MKMYYVINKKRKQRKLRNETKQIEIRIPLTHCTQIGRSIHSNRSRRGHVLKNLYTTAVRLNDRVFAVYAHAGRTMWTLLIPLRFNLRRTSLYVLALFGFLLLLLLQNKSVRSNSIGRWRCKPTKVLRFPWSDLVKCYRSNSIQTFTQGDGKRFAICTFIHTVDLFNGRAFQYREI